MPTAPENPNAHAPRLGRRHDDGPSQSRLSPAERALAPESTAPMQSDSASAVDGSYVGRDGGYAGASAAIRSPGADPRGDSTYGYPAGPGVGMPGGEHQPADRKTEPLPPQYPER